MDNKFVLISGCSGGGKSSLLAELKARGHTVVAEPGRRIIADETARDGCAVPWGDLTALLRAAADMALADRAAVADHKGWVFFDRGLVDAASALEKLSGDLIWRSLCMMHRYHQRVFMAPPWPEIYVRDAERQHDFGAGMAEYDRLMETFPVLGYDVILLPKVSVKQRADFVLASLAEDMGLVEDMGKG